MLAGPEAWAQLPDSVDMSAGEAFRSVYDRYRHPSFLGLSFGFTTVPGTYTPYPGMRMQFLAGPTVGVQGAWFASPCWGFGGRMACTNLRMKVNGVGQNDNLECASLYVGPYFSYPVSMRWLMGGGETVGRLRNLQIVRYPPAKSGWPERILVRHGHLVHLPRHTESRRALLDRLRCRPARRPHLAPAAAQTHLQHGNLRNSYRNGLPSAARDSLSVTLSFT